MELCNSQAIPSPIGCDSKYVQPTIEQRLIQKKQRLVQDLQETTEALEALQANPEVNKILCLITKISY